MKRKFNTEGQCAPELHYMVRLDGRMREIKERYVEPGSYFVINRGRQYGKTTTLWALEEYLKNDYLVVLMDFQEAGSADFQDEDTFSRAFVEMLLGVFRDMGMGREEIAEPLIHLKKDGKMTLRELFSRLSELCRNSPKPVILMIDEIDSAGNYQVFIDFLAHLRRYYLNRRRRPIFHSVILAGVYDIKNLKLKMRPEEEHKYNSPWNIAAEFDVNMNFAAAQIGAMLDEYESDHHTGMDIETVSKEIYQYTSGYPYLVSLLCKILDEKLSGSELFKDKRSIWTRKGITEAVRIILKSRTPLFDSMAKQLDTFCDLRNMIQEILYQGKQFLFSPYVRSVNLGMMFGFLKEENGYIAVANRIFEMGMLNMFIAEEAIESDAYQYGERDRNQFVKDQRLDMDLVLKKFIEYFTDIYSDSDERFVESYGRKMFLLYLKPIINGKGNYYLEAQTRNAKRTDVVVDYQGEQFVVELKIWHGSEYNKRGERQLAEYLDYFHQEKGYMLSFNFNKNKKVGLNELQIQGKTIIEAVV